MIDLLEDGILSDKLEKMSLLNDIKLRIIY